MVWLFYWLFRTFPQLNNAASDASARLYDETLAGRLRGVELEPSNLHVIHYDGEPSIKNSRQISYEALKQDAIRAHAASALRRRIKQSECE